MRTAAVAIGLPSLVNCNCSRLRFCAHIFSSSTYCEGHCSFTCPHAALAWPQGLCARKVKLSLLHLCGYRASVLARSRFHCCACMAMVFKDQDAPASKGPWSALPFSDSIQLVACVGMGRSWLCTHEATTSWSNWAPAQFNTLSYSTYQLVSYLNQEGASSISTKWWIS